MPDAGGRTSSVKTWLLLYTDAKFDIDIFYFYVCFNLFQPRAIHCLNITSTAIDVVCQNSPLAEPMTSCARTLHLLGR
jgi:hypothetical protein